MTPKTLLVTDDAIIIREIIKDAARGAGWEIAGEAGDGSEAIELYQRLHPTACTLDLVMPKCGGLEALHAIRTMDPAARVCVVSALDQKDILKEAFRLGACDFIVKPFPSRLLLDTLDKLASS